MKEGDQKILTTFKNLEDDVVNAITNKLHPSQTVSVVSESYAQIQNEGAKNGNSSETNKIWVLLIA